MNDKPKKRGFAALSPERRREISSKGGKATPNNFRTNPKFASEVAKKREADNRSRRLNAE